VLEGVSENACAVCSVSACSKILLCFMSLLAQWPLEIRQEIVGVMNTVFGNTVFI
jgi:hypothetical protein